GPFEKIALLWSISIGRVKGGVTNRITATCIAGKRSKINIAIRIHFFALGLNIFCYETAMALSTQPIFALWAQRQGKKPIEDKTVIQAELNSKRRELRWKRARRSVGLLRR